MEITGVLFCKKKSIVCVLYELRFVLPTFDIFVLSLNWRKPHLLSSVYEIFMRHCPGSFQVTCVFSGGCWCVRV